MDAPSYLDSIRLCLTTSDFVQDVEIVRETSVENQGFFRARLRLQNGDFLEVSEFFVVEHDQVVTKEYRHQWMDPTRQQLRRRWDNAPHYPGLAGYPDHVHVEAESRVEPGAPLSIVALIQLLETETGA